MNTNQKMVMGMFAVTLVTVIWLFRWDIKVGGDGSRLARLDRWTGEMALCAGFVSCSTLEFDE